MMSKTSVCGVPNLEGATINVLSLGAEVKADSLVPSIFLSSSPSPLRSPTLSQF